MFSIYLRNILLMCVFFSLTSVGQTTFTHELMKKSSSGSCVSIKHSAKIDSLVNGLLKVSTKSNVSTLPNGGYSELNLGRDSFGSNVAFLDSLVVLKPLSYRKIEGYRIQIYTGANSRHDKNIAFSLKDKCKDLFPNLETYANFIAPRWVVRIGDFETRTEAVSFVQKIKESGVSREARVVKCNILLPVY